MTNFSPEDIDSFIKALNAMNAIHPWIGTAVALIGLITGAFTAYNTIKTKLNTKANDKTAELLTAHAAEMKTHNDRMAEHEKKMIALKDDAINQISKTVEGVTLALHASQQSFSEELKTFALKNMRIKELVDTRLAMVPGVQDAIERERKRVDEILNVLTKGKAQGGG